MQYAGNVLVYGAVSPCDGDWFGGVNKCNAASFLDAVINAEVSDSFPPWQYICACCTIPAYSMLHTTLLVAAASKMLFKH